MRYIEENIGKAQYDTELSGYRLLDSGTIQIANNVVMPNYTYHHSDNTTMYRYSSNKISSVNNDRDLTIGGIFETIYSINRINGLTIVVTLNHIYTSVDEIDYVKYNRPKPINIATVFCSNSDFCLIFDGGVCTELNTPLLKVNTSSGEYKFPPNFTKLARPISLLNTEQLWYKGYICSGGMWSSQIVSNYVVDGSYNIAPVLISQYNEIFGVNTFENLGIHWDDNVWSWDYYAYIGAFIPDVEYVQFFSCSNGALAYRLLDSAEIGSTTVLPTNITIGSDLIYCVVQFQFTYDKETIDQLNKDRTCFEKYYAISSDSIIELTWTGISFNTSTAVTQAINEVLFYDIEYVSKYNMYNQIIGTEVHKLHIYCVSGQYICIDASDKAIQPIISISNIGIDITNCFINSIDNKVTLIDSSNSIYYLQNRLITFVASIPQQYSIIAIRNNWIVTDKVMIYYSSIFGLSLEHDIVYTKGVNSIPNGWTYATGYCFVYLDTEEQMFYLVSSEAKTSYKTSDFITYIKDDISVFPPIYNSSVYFRVINGTKYIAFSGEGNYLFHRTTDGYIPGIKDYPYRNNYYVMTNNGLINSSSVLFSIYNELPVGALKSIYYNNTVSSSITFASISFTQSSYTSYYALFISGKCKNIGVRATISNSITAQVYYSDFVGYLDYSTYKMLFLSLPQMSIGGEFNITFSFYAYYINMPTEFNLQLHKVCAIDPFTNSESSVLCDDFNNIVYSIDGGWQSVYTCYLKFSYRLFDYFSSPLLPEELGVSGYRLFSDGQTDYIIRPDKKVIKIDNSNFSDQLLPIELSWEKLLKISSTAYACLSHGKIIDHNNKTCNGAKVLSMPLNYINSYDGCVIAFSNDGWISYLYANYDILNPTYSSFNTLYITMHKVASYSLNCSTKINTKLIAVGNNGIVCSQLNIYYAWATQYITTENLIKVYTFTIASQYKLVTFSQSSLFISNDYGETFNQVQLEGNFKTAAQHPNGRMVILGNNFIAHSTNAIDWVILGHNLVFEPNSIAIYNSSFYVGCNNGKILQSVDGLYWSFITSSVDANITTLIYGVVNYVSGLFGDFKGAKQPNLILQNGDMVSIGSTTYEIADVNNVSFSIIGININSGIFSLFLKHNWTDILKEPKFKLYSDITCQTELNLIVYQVISYSYEIVDQLCTFTFIFEQTCDINTIEYVCGYIDCVKDSKSATLELTLRPTNKVSNTITAEYSMVDLGLDGYELTNYNVYSDYYSVFIGIPYNCFSLVFSSDRLSEEYDYTSVFLKLNETALYDNLTITSRDPFKPTTFKQLATTSDAVQLSGYSFLHNMSKHSFFTPYPNATQVYNLNSVYINDLLLNNMSSDAKLIIEGKVATIDIVEENKYCQLTEVKLTFGDGLSIYSAQSGYVCKNNSLVLIDSNCTLQITDRVNEYYRIRSNNGFKHLKTITNSIIIFNNRVYSQMSQRTTSMASYGPGWYYISDSEIAVYPYVLYDNYYNRLLYTVPIVSFSGPLYCVISQEAFEYSSTAYQSLYQYFGGDLEFSLPSAPDTWHRTLDIPQLSDGSIQINIRRLANNYKPKVFCNNIISIHGIEYQI